MKVERELIFCHATALYMCEDRGVKANAATPA